MKKLILLFIGILLIFSISASTTQITKWGATVLQTDDNFTEFRDALLTFPDCHMSKANETYMTKTRVFEMLCHINMNNTEKILWENAILSFYGYSPLMNISQPAIVFENNSIIDLDRVSFSITGNVTNGKTIMGMDNDLFIGACNDKITLPSNTNANYDSDTWINIDNSAFKSISYQEDGTKEIGSLTKNFATNFFCESNMTNVFFEGSQPSGQSYTNTRGASTYIEKVDTLLSTNIYAWLGGFHIENSERVTLKHNTYCFVPSRATVSGTLTDAYLECNGNLGFAFLGNMMLNFVDSVADSFVFSGFLSNWDMKVYNTINNKFRDEEGVGVQTNYSIVSNNGTTYSGDGTKFDETILIEVYSNVDGYEQYNNFNITIQNSSFFPFTNYPWNITEKQQGYIPMIKIPYAITLNPGSSLNLKI